MANEQALGDTVRTWVVEVLPGDVGAAERAVFVAEAAYRKGASVSEAFEAAQSFVGSWVRHPAHRVHRGEKGSVLPLAS